MTPEQAWSIIEKIRYKKMKFRALRGLSALDRFLPPEERNRGELIVEMEARVTCIFTGKEIPLTLTFALMTDHLSEDMIVNYVFQHCMEFERHECAEFFQYDGKRPFDPHVKDPGHESKPAGVYDLWDRMTPKPFHARPVTITSKDYYD